MNILRCSRGHETFKWLEVFFYSPASGESDSLCIQFFFPGSSCPNTCYVKSAFKVLLKKRLRHGRRRRRKRRRRRRRKRRRRKRKRRRRRKRKRAKRGPMLY